MSSKKPRKSPEPQIYEPSTFGGNYVELDPVHTDPARIKRERQKAKDLRASAWWKQKLQLGVCHYCNQKFLSKDLTMDHLVPLARGGMSTKGNLVTACQPCNENKKLKTPAEQIFEKLKS